jgi:two-component system, NarL family, nitrate/nitrite response regulator NarL
LRFRRKPLDNMCENISVLIADDHPAFREGLRLLLETDPKIHVVGEARDGKEAADLVCELKPNVVLLDLRMPRCSGMDALKMIRRLSLPVRILILATEVRRSEIVELLSYGASGIVLKETATHLIRKSISTVMAGQYWIEREGISELTHDLEKGPRMASLDVANKNWRLTPREEQIVAEVVSGKTNNEIAQTLGVSAQTVKHHLTSIFDKVGVYNRLELALFYVNYSSLGDVDVHEVEVDTATSQDRFHSHQNETGLATPKPIKPIHFSAAGVDLRERTVSLQGVPGPGTAAAKRIPSRSIG